MSQDEMFYFVFFLFQRRKHSSWPEETPNSSHQSAKGASITGILVRLFVMLTVLMSFL